MARVVDYECRVLVSAGDLWKCMRILWYVSVCVNKCVYMHELGMWVSACDSPCELGCGYLGVVFFMSRNGEWE